MDHPASLDGRDELIAVIDELQAGAQWETTLRAVFSKPCPP